MNRRQFLKNGIHGIGGAALSLSPLGIFLNSLVQSQLNRAYAVGTSGETAFLEKKLLNIVLSGGAPRNFFDLPLKPDGSSSVFYMNPLLSTKLIQDASSDGVSGYRGVYETCKIGSFDMPYFWTGKIPTPTGKTDVAPLANHLIVMRGLNMVDIHEGGRAMQLRPNTGLSVDGMIADRSKAIFPAIGIGATGVALFKNFYRSSSGVNLAMANGRLGHNHLPTNPLGDLFSSFSGKATLRSNSVGIGEAMDFALNAMKEQSGEFHKLVPSSFQQRANAKSMMQKSFSHLAEVYASLYNKYKTLMDRSLTEPDLRLQGVDDLSLSGFSHHFYKVKTQSMYYNGDVIDLINSSSYVENLASSMAIAEYLVLGDPAMSESFTSAAHLMIGAIGKSNLKLFNISTNSAVPTGDISDFTLYTDSHEEGFYLQMVHYARYYRAIAACTYELIQKLKSRDRFRDTVITLTSEFHRIPRKDGNGSDHGYAGSVMSVLTGMTDELQVYGDIKTAVEPLPANAPSGTPLSPSSNGTWGLFAPVPEFGNQPAVLGNAVTSVCNLLDLPSPTPNNPGFFKKNSTTGKVLPLINRRPRNDPFA